MIVTEEEAKAKWCPMARSAWGSEAPTNRTLDGNPRLDCMCIGAACMHWRWAGPEVRQSHSSTKREGWRFIAAPDCYDHDRNEPFWLEPRNDAQKRRRGYCGLAGNPDHA